MEKGLRWSFREVLRGKSGVIMAVELVGISVLLVVIWLTSKNIAAPGTLFADFLADVLTLKADKFGVNLCMLMIVLVPVMLACWPVIAGILVLALNIRDRNVERTPENLEMHRIDTQRAWTWPWSIVVGVFDYTALFSLLLTVFTLLGGESLSPQAQKLWTLLFAILGLVFAERRVTYASRTSAGRLEGNYAVVSALLSGNLDERLPEGYRNELGRAKAATVVRIGITRSPRWAARVAAGIDLRTRVKLFSGFLNSAIHGMLTAVSFGIATTAANSLGNVGGQFGSGKGEEYAASLRQVTQEKPRFVVEALAFAYCVVLGAAIALF